MLRRFRSEQIPGVERGPDHPSTTTVVESPAQAVAPEDGDMVWLHHHGLSLHPGRRLCVVDVLGGSVVRVAVMPARRTSRPWSSSMAPS